MKTENILNNINYIELYKKITIQEIKNEEHLYLFIKFIFDMYNNNGTNPLYYEMETLSDFADIFNKKTELKKILSFK